MAHFVDRLIEGIGQKGAAVCVGIDPVFSRLPKALRAGAEDNASQAAAIETFGVGVLDAVAEFTPCVKYQSACYERYGVDGMAVYARLIAAAQERGLLVISDAKRGDIGSSSAHYAAAAFDPPVSVPGGAAADALTVNSYLGMDGIEPMAKKAAEVEGGLFTLVRTSNRGGDALQSLKLEDGRSVAEAVAGLVDAFGSQGIYVGESGFSLIGAVVGATKKEDAAALRKLMPRQMFLVPGYGAQGAGADDVRACFKEDGTGALITASRSITFAFDPKATGAEDESDWKGKVAAAAKLMRDEIKGIVG